MFLSSCATKKQNFNSIKVRLEPADAHIPSMKAMTFQFHKGAIRTILKVVAGGGYNISIP